MTMPDVITQLVERHGRYSTLSCNCWLVPNICRQSVQRDWLAVGLYQQGTGEYAGTLIALFELLLTDRVPTEIRWSPEFWDDEGMAIDQAWFAQYCADHLVTTGWLTNVQGMVQGARP